MRGIITADWHLRKDVPVARTETEAEWLALQIETMGKVRECGEREKLPIYHLGDIYHRSQPYYGIVSMINDVLNGYPYAIYKIAGNHDLPYNTFANVRNSAWYSTVGLDLAQSVEGAFHFGEPSPQIACGVVFTHQLTFPNEKEKPPMAEGKTAGELLSEFPNASWIFTGDYHKAFHYKEKGRHVINSGCLLRQSATEEGYNTGFYIVDTDEDRVEFHSVGDTKPMQTQHLEREKERNTRIDAFIESVKDSGKVSLSYSENLVKKLNDKSISLKVKEIVTEIKEEIQV